MVKVGVSLRVGVLLMTGVCVAVTPDETDGVTGLVRDGVWPGVRVGCAVNVDVMVMVPVCVPEAASDDDGDCVTAGLDDTEAPTDREGDGETVGEAGTTIYESEAKLLGVFISLAEMAETT